jgi:hypothetical protein
MQLDQALHQRQPKAEAALTAIQCRAGLHERLEQATEHRRLDANSGIDDPNPGAPPRRDGPRADPDPLSRRCIVGRSAIFPSPKRIHTTASSVALAHPAMGGRVSSGSS